MENNLETLSKNVEVMIHKMARQYDTFSETFKRRFAATLMKKKLFWGVNRWEKDALYM